MRTNGRHSSWCDWVWSRQSRDLEISCFQRCVYALSLALAPTGGDLQESIAGLDEESAECMCTCMCRVSCFLFGKS